MAIYDRIVLGGENVNKFPVLQFAACLGERNRNGMSRGEILVLLNVTIAAEIAEVDRILAANDLVPVARREEFRNMITDLMLLAERGLKYTKIDEKAFFDRIDAFVATTVP